MSYLKLVDVPYSLNDKTVTPKVVLSHLNRSGLLYLLILSTPPRVVQDSCMLDMAMVYLNVADSVSSVPSQLVSSIWPICVSIQGCQG